VPDAEVFQVCVRNDDSRPTNSLPLLGGDELPILVPDDVAHWGARLVAGGGANLGVRLAVIEPPKDGWWIPKGALGRTKGGEGWRRLADGRQLGGRLARAQGRTRRAGERGGYKKN
jgi:hypothetical protein